MPTLLALDLLRPRRPGRSRPALRHLRRRPRRDVRSPSTASSPARMNWVGNWSLWSALRWSDISALRARPPGPRAQPAAGPRARRPVHRRRRARLRAAGRRTPSAPSTGCSRRPLWRRIVRLAPFALRAARRRRRPAGRRRRRLPGQGGSRRRSGTTGAEPGHLEGRAAAGRSPTSTLDLELDPARRWLSDHGSYELVNDRDKPLAALRAHRRPALGEGALDPGRQALQAGEPLGPLRLHAAGAAAAGRPRPRRLPARGGLPAGDHQERRRQPWSSSSPRAWC